MIERYGGNFDVSCDNCGYSEEFDGPDWNAMIADVKAAGWKNVRVNGEWENHCPSCCGPEAAFR